MSLITPLARQNPSTVSLAITLFARHLSSATASTIPSKLHDRYSFEPPASLSPTSQSSTNTIVKPKKKQKPQYSPPSSLDRTGRKPVHSDLPFDFRYSYTENSPTVRPIRLREPKYSPFGPGRLDRPWIGVCAPAMDPKVKSLEGEEDPNLTEQRMKRRELIQGKPLTGAERKLLVFKCERSKTKRQINLGKCWFWFFLFGVLVFVVVFEGNIITIVDCSLCSATRLEFFTLLSNRS